MEVLLIYPFGGPSPISPPLGLLHLNTILKKKGITSKVLYLSNTYDLSFFDLITEETVCIGISVMTGLQISIGIWLSQTIKHKFPFIKIIWGGVHPSLSSKQTSKCEYIDIVCKGEFENEIVSLVNSIKKKETLPKIIENKKLFDLNTLPVLDYSDIDKESFRLGFNHPFYKFTTDNIGTIELTRGCPFSCYYCVQNKFRTPFRYMSTENVLKHFDNLKRNGFKAIIVADDNFFLNPKWIETLIEIKSYNLELYISIPVTIVDKMKNSDFTIMKDSGIKSLGISIESGSDRMLQIIGKKHSIEMTYKINKKLRDYDFIVNYNFIAGYPEETLDDITLTYDTMMKLLKDNEKASVNIKKLIPTPNTDVYKNCLKNGMIEPQLLIDWVNMVDLEWEKEYNYINVDVQDFYKRHKEFNKMLEFFCWSRNSDEKPFDILNRFYERYK